MDNDVLKNIKKIIAGKGLKQNYVAEKMNISNKSLSDILHKRKKLSVDLVISFCEVLGVSPNDIFGYTK